MSNAVNRILIALGIAVVLLLAALAENVGWHGVFWLSMFVVGAAIFEFLRCLWNAPRKVMFNLKNIVIFICFGALLALDFWTLLTLGKRPAIMLMLLIIICSADICAWLFGVLIGGDKLWEKISANKTWTGQIFGVLGGTTASIAYGYIMSGNFMPQLLWIGISISLLSQYGDFTASFVKRKLQIKDFSHVLGAHGGIMDRFDGWIYALPVIWIVLV
ncbi:MAG: phosphatidate cytidylyltransferase [Alphaproteobacteria bacterium]|nr:phosphatidate cytidylyltransferase [Alphaproteobacteria bacterium]